MICFRRFSEFTCLVMNFRLPHLCFVLLTIYLLFRKATEGNALLKCVCSGLNPLSTVSQSYYDGVWLLQGAQCGLVAPIFIHIIRDFPVSYMLMAVDFSCTQYGYSVHMFSLY